MPRGIAKNPEEKRTKQRAAGIGKSLSEMGHNPDCNCCICKAKRGEKRGPRSQETIEKISNANRGKTRSEEQIANIKEGCKKRPPHSEESNRKRSEAQKGVPKPSKLKGKPYEEIYGEEKAKELKANYSGENNPNWQGGTSYDVYPEEFFRMIPIIRERDEVCQICGKMVKENGEELSVHHIDYNKDNNDPSNLVSLCRNNHVGTNSNRDYWQHYFEVCWLIPNKQLLVA